jgi:YfiH family protein
VNLPTPFAWAGDHISVELAGARALFTTRRGGVSAGAYESLNLGLWTDDDPGCVSVNRDRVARETGIARERFAQGRQVHGAHVARVREAPAGEPAPADGQATALRGVAPVVLVADCLPVALASREAVAMLHCGWRGLAAGIVADGVRALRELGAGDPLAAAIGPGAGACCYEVGDEVRAAFGEADGAAGTAGHLDLKAIAAARLREAGVGEVHDVDVCTICTSSRPLFFSHRRDAGRTGRQAGVAWLT